MASRIRRSIFLNQTAGNTASRLVCAIRRACFRAEANLRSPCARDAAERQEPCQVRRSAASARRRDIRLRTGAPDRRGTAQAALAAAGVARTIRLLRRVLRGPCRGSGGGPVDTRTASRLSRPDRNGSDRVRRSGRAGSLNVTTGLSVGVGRATGVVSCVA